MLLSDKYFRKENECELVSSWRSQQGNILFMILLTIAVLAMLTYALSQNSQEQSGVLPQQTSTDQINRMLTYASALGGALQQMVVNGENPNTLYSNLVLTSSGFTTEAHNLEIYHPLGGGITYMSASSPDSTAVATGYHINPNAIISGVGCSSGAGCIVTSAPTTGHIVFGATIASASYCEKINNILTGSSLTTVPPVMTTADFTTLLTTTTAVTIGSDCTPSCANIPRLCVSNTAATAWGFYADLFPPQYSNPQ